MARVKGTFKAPFNYEVQIRGEFDARKYVPTYADLLAFTEEDKIPTDFLVVCGGQDDPTKRGIWLFSGTDANLSDPAYWEPASSGDSSELIAMIEQEILDRVAGDENTLEEAKIYADLLTTDVLRYAGEWDASTGTFPSEGTGEGGIVRRGDEYYISEEGTIAGVDYEIGDSLRAKQDEPAQIPTNWGSGQVNTQQATTTRVGISRMATSAEAIARSSSILNLTPSSGNALILDEKKKYVKECYVLAVMKIIIPMKAAGTFTAIEHSSAMGSLRYKIGAGGTFTEFTTPVSYAANSEIYLQWYYTSPVEQEGWIRIIGRDS